MKRQKLLERAEKHVFSTGLNDAAAHLSKVNMKYGLAKMHFVQSKLGLEPNATFISTPDETISRNVVRWEAGVSYGGKITWGNGKEKLIFLDVKPNCCGILVGALKKIPEPKEILRRVHLLGKEKTYINDIEVKWDFWKGNHFIDVFTVESKSKKLPKYALVLHAGCPEFKSDNVKGSGLYWNKSESLSKVYDKIKTPFGYTYVLQGSHAKEYMKQHSIAEKFAHERRMVAFNKIFGGRERDVITNKTHQGMLNMNEITLGCQHIESESEILPISIRADLPSYLMHPAYNFKKKTLEELGFDERAEELGVYKRLRKANLLPHGGGYTFNDSLKVNKVFEVNSKRFFEIEMIDGVGKKIISNARELQYSYRSSEVIKRTIELDLGKLFARLDPVYTIKV